MATLSVDVSPEFLDFLKIFQIKHKREIWNMCGELNQSATFRYIMLRAIPLIDPESCKKTFGDKFKIPIYDMPAIFGDNMDDIEKRGKLFVKWAQEYGLNINTEKRIIGGRSQWVKTINNKIIYVIEDDRKELKEQNMPKLLSENNKLTNNDTKEDDQKLDCGDTKIIEAINKDISIPDKQIQSKSNNVVDKLKTKSMLNKLRYYHS